MSSPDQERLEAIAETLVRILKRQDELDARLRRLEAGEAPPVHQPAPPPLPAATRPALAPPIVAFVAPPPLPSLEPSSPARLETRVGLNWINRIGVVTLLFAAAFGFDYAVENNWIGPGARVALGLMAAVAAAFAGDWMRNRAHEIFAQGLTGLGIALAYLSLYASFTLYHVFPQSLAFLLMMLTTAAAAALALRYGSQAIAILGLIGGYLTPLLLSTGEDHPWILLSYVFLVNLGALAIARTRRWRAVESLALAGTALLFGAWFLQPQADSKRIVATVFAIAFYAEFAGSPQFLIWMAAQILPSLFVASAWKEAAPALLLAFLFAAAGLVLAESRRWAKAPAWTLLCYSIAYLSWRFNHQSAPAEPIFLLLTAAFLLFAAWMFWRAISKIRPFDPAELIVLATNGAAYFAASYLLLDASYHPLMGAFTFLLGGIHLLLAKLLWSEELPGLFAAAVALSFLTLAIPIQFAGFGVAMAWSLEAAALAWLAVRFHQPPFQYGSWIVFTLAVYHLLMADATMDVTAALINPRFLTFAVTAVALWLAARFARTGLEAALPYVVGHAVLLLALALEISDWATRSVAAADVWSTKSTAFSILLALYALVLVMLGVATRTSINRILGLVLLSIVIVKLYLLDVWSLATGFRITAFLGLGILLLLVSYLYSRYKPVLERLWKDDR